MAFLSYSETKLFDLTFVLCVEQKRNNVTAWLHKYGFKDAEFFKPVLADELNITQLVVSESDLYKRLIFCYCVKVRI